MEFKEARISHDSKDVPTRREVEQSISRMGDYVKMDYLSSMLKKHLDFDTKKFVLTKLSEIYESRKMFLESARLLRISAEINTIMDSKINDFLKSAELFVKSGNFEEAEVSIKKANAVANSRQKLEIKLKAKSYYKDQAKEYLIRDKRKHALIAYEKILEFDLNDYEKKEIQKTLLELYERLGKVKEYNNLKSSLNL